MSRLEEIILTRANNALNKINDIELRDIFAMQALNGILAGSVKLDGISNYTPESVASGSYIIADAMLEARKKK